uniref:lipopolysaccharide biosynthesis protein n=1 Tax=Aliarcobacter sp. TaxID=2321116 RepID=UPI0040488285
MLNKLKPKSEFSRNVLTLMTGTTIAQAIPIAISPILTRIYTPEDFGVFALYMAIASIAAVIATGRYEMAIMLPKKDSDAINIVALSILISFFISFISLIIVFIFNSQITNLLNNPEISNWLYFIPITVLLTGIYQSFNYWSNRKKHYKRLAISRVVQSASTASANLGMGFGGLGSSGLIVGQVLGHFTAMIILFKQVFEADKEYCSEINKLKIIILFKRYISFLKFGVLALFTSNLAGQSLFFLVSIYLNATILGFISLILRLISIPSAFLSSNLGDVFYQEISQVKKNQSYEMIRNFTKKLTIYSYIIYLIIYVILDNYFVFIFGEQWEEAVIYIKYLLIVAVFSFIFSPLTMLFNYFEIQNYNFFWQLSWLVSNILIFILYGYLDFTVEVLFLIYTIKQVLLYIIGICLFLIYAKRLKYEK